MELRNVILNGGNRGALESARKRLLQDGSMVNLWQRCLCVRTKRRHLRQQRQYTLRLPLLQMTRASIDWLFGKSRKFDPSVPCPRLLSLRKLCGPIVGLTPIMIFENLSKVGFMPATLWKSELLCVVWIPATLRVSGFL